MFGTQNALSVDPAGKVCPICGGPGSPVHGSEFNLRECCGTLLSWQWKDEEEYENWYKTPEGFHLVEPERLDRGQYKTEERHEEDYQAALKRIGLLRSLGIGAGNLVDIGAGSGAFVHAANRTGLNARGLEVNPDLWTNFVHAGSWRQATGKHDIITLHDVFEHLTRPNECLAHVRNCLVEKGVLVIEQPEWDFDFTNRHIKPLQHPVMYSKQAAERLYERHAYHQIAFYRPLRGTLQKMAHFLMVKE